MSKTEKTSARRAKKPAGKKQAQRAPRLPSEGKIVMVTLENPRRPKTAQHDRYAALLKSRNKPVSSIVGKEGLTSALRYAMAQGHAKVVGGK